MKLINPNPTPSGNVPPLEVKVEIFSWKFKENPMVTEPLSIRQIISRRGAVR